MPFWLNVPLAVAFTRGLVRDWRGRSCARPPLAKVLRNPDWGPERAGGYRVQLAEPGQAGAVVRSEPRVDALALAGMQR